MKSKKLLVLFNLVLALVVVAFVKKYWNEKKDAELAKEAAPESDVLPKEIVPAAVARIEITAPAEKALTLEKNANGDWTIPSQFNTRAAKWSIDELLKNVSGIEGELRSEKPDVLGDFSLTDEQAIHVKLSGEGGTEIAHLLVSPERPYGRQNFVRAQGSDLVYATRTDVLSALGIFEKTDKPKYKTFAHLQTLKFDVSKASSVKLGGSLELVKKENAEDKSTAWEFVPKDASEIDPAKVSELLSQAVNVYGQEAIDPAEDNAYGKSALLSVTHDENGKTVTSELFAGKPSAADAALVAVKVMPDNLAWHVPASTVEKLKKAKTFFLKAKPAAESQKAT